MCLLFPADAASASVLPVRGFAGADGAVARVGLAEMTAVTANTQRCLLTRETDSLVGWFVCRLAGHYLPLKWKSYDGTSVLNPEFR